MKIARITVYRACVRLLMASAAAGPSTSGNPEPDETLRLKPRRRAGGCGPLGALGIDKTQLKTGIGVLGRHGRDHGPRSGGDQIPGKL